MTPAPTRFEVIPTGTEWEIKRDGSDFLAVQTKEVAIDEALFQAARAEPSQVVVKRLDGGTEDETSFGNGAPTSTAGPQPVRSLGNSNPQ